MKMRKRFRTINTKDKIKFSSLHTAQYIFSRFLHRAPYYDGIDLRLHCSGHDLDLDHPKKILLKPKVRLYEKKEANDQKVNLNKYFLAWIYWGGTLGW